MKKLSTLIYFTFIFCLISFFSGILPSSACAKIDTNNEAYISLKGNMDAFLAILGDPAFKNPSTRPALKSKAETLVMSFFDFERFSQTTVGPTWRSFTPEQRKAFVTAFTDLLRNTYINSFDDYNGEKPEYNSLLQTKEKELDINASVNMQGKNVPFTFKMHKRNDKWLIYDLILIDGISMIRNYQNQFKSALSRQSPEEVVKIIEEQTAKVKAKNG